MTDVDDAMNELLAAQREWAEAQAGENPKRMAAANERRDVAIETALEARVEMSAVSQATGRGVEEFRRTFE